LNISRQFARSIFIYFIGLSFHSLAFDGAGEFHKQIDFLDKIFRPVIVDAPEDMDKTAEKFKDITRTFLMNSFVTPKPTLAKKIKGTRIKKTTARSKRAEVNRKGQALKKTIKQ